MQLSALNSLSLCHPSPGIYMSQCAPFAGVRTSFYHFIIVYMVIFIYYHGVCSYDQCIVVPLLFPFRG